MNIKKLAFFDCPQWWCWLFSRHAMIHRFANYNTDASGKTCGCGRRFADDICITVEQQTKGYIDKVSDRYTDPEHPEVVHYEHYLLILLLLFVGCRSSSSSPKPEHPYVPPQTHFVVTGYIRSVENDTTSDWWNGRNELYTIVVQEDDGGMRSLRFVERPPVWNGLHCKIEWDKEEWETRAKNIRITEIK